MPSLPAIGIITCLRNPGQQTRDYHSEHSLTQILVVTRNLPPLIGGMERLNLEMIRALAQEFEVAVCGPSGAAAILPGLEIEEVPLNPLSRFLLNAGRASVAMAKRLRPRVVIAGSGLTAPLALAAGWRARAQTLAYVHGLDLVVDNAIYQALWVPAIRRMDAVICNSVSTRDTATARGVLRSRTDVIYCGASPPSLSKASGGGEGARGLPSGDFIVSVGRLLRRKGLPEFIERSLPAVLIRHPELQFVIIGGEADQALRRGTGSERSRIEQAIVRAGLEKSVRLLGVVDTTTLVEALERARAFVFPVLEIRGDVEGFGAVALEAAASGCPTVAFAVGGVVDAVRHGESGFLVPGGDYELMADRLCDLAALDEDRRRVLSTRARVVAAEFTWDRFANQMRDSVRRLAGERSRR